MRCENDTLIIRMVVVPIRPPPRSKEKDDSDISHCCVYYIHMNNEISNDELKMHYCIGNDGIFI